jgi:lysophospholipase L1-like esterase
MLRRALGNLALVAFGVLVAFAIGELTARLTWRPPPDPPRAATADRPELPVLKTLMQLARPNTRGVMPNRTYYRTNSRGVRGPEYARPAPPGVFRIVIAGDSITMGAGVEEEDTYAARLEAALAARHPDRRFEVINAGLAGLDIEQVVGRLEKVGLPYAPDLVVYGWTMNDITGPDYRELERPRIVNNMYETIYQRHAHSRWYLLRVLWPHWVSLRELVDPSPLSYLAELRHNYFDNPAAWGRFTAQLDRLAAIGQSRGICVVVLIHTALARLTAFHPMSTIYERVAEAARERGMYPVQSLPRFVGRAEAAVRVHAADSHPNRLGHQLLADALLEGIEDLPDDCRRWR